MQAADRDRPEILFVLGIYQRSGTNFLFDLLSLHPLCAPIRDIWEDKILTQVHLLEEYVEKVSATWAEHWDPHGTAKARLRDHLSSACLDWIATLPKASHLDGARYVVTKSPSVDNLDRLSFFLPARTVVVIRDGRAVAESYARSFGRTVEQTAERWAQRARAILAAAADGPFLLSRYEDLVSDLESELTRIFDYLDLDPEAIDFDTAANLPVRGSSSFGTKDGRPLWMPTEKTDDFRPLERFAHWDEEQHRRFNDLAGAELEALGYTPEPTV